MNSWLDIKEKFKKAPKTPGVYIFLDKRGVLYVGKASDLKNRLRSYVKPGNFKNERLQKNAIDLKLIPLRSEIEALIEEAKLIKKLNPPYNVLWRDDKTYFYALFTRDKFPRIFVVHKNQIVRHSGFEVRGDNLIGPFTEGRALRLVLRMLRRSFPYCTCARPHLRICLNAQIENCSGFCCQKSMKPSTEQSRRYKKNIRTIKNFLVGEPLKNFSRNLKQEEKSALEKILAHREFLDFQARDDANQNADQRGKNIPCESAISPRKSAMLVEGYDISHLSGKETVAGMTAWSIVAGKIFPRKDFWRKFIIRTAKPSDDPAAIFEVVSRRLKHPEWPYPNLMVIDGGIGQFGAAKKALRQSSGQALRQSSQPPRGFGGQAGQALRRNSKQVIKDHDKIKIISFAKPEQLVYGLKETPSALSDAPANLQKIIPAVISKTHDFAISFHRQRRKKVFLKNAGL